MDEKQKNSSLTCIDVLNIWGSVIFPELMNLIVIFGHILEFANIVIIWNKCDKFIRLSGYHHGI